MNNEDRKKIVELYKSGKTNESSKGKTLSEEHKRRISKSCRTSVKAKSYHLSQRKILRKGYDNLTEGLAYIAGVLITDGYIISAGGIGLESIDKEFVDLFADCCERQFGVNPNRYENASRMMPHAETDKKYNYMTKMRYMVRFGSVVLKELCEQINADWIRRLPNNLKLHALRGMWDGDGCYASYIVKEKTYQRKVCQVLFYNKDEDIINLYEELLTLLGISGRYIKQPNGVFKYYFGRRAQIKKFFNAITSVIERKKVKIDADLASWS